jgi:glycosyltransferase involved in cell wall biosynthesis
LKMANTIISMLGAREHYEPVVMAEVAGVLSTFVTDLWNPWGSAGQSLATRIGFGPLTRFSSRFSNSVPKHKVRVLTRLGVEYWWRKANAKTPKDLYSVFEQMGSRFARAATSFITDEHDTFLGFASASLETIQQAQRLGLRTVVDQIDPGPLQHRIIRAEEQKYKHLLNMVTTIPDSYYARIEREWDAATAIIVNSGWSKRALVSQGVSDAKVSIVPLAYRTRSSRHVARSTTRISRQKLRVLWLGTMCLIKGLPYSIEAAMLLTGAPVELTFAGPTDLRLENLAFPKNCRYLGPVARSQTELLYRSHDLFLFPTLSDGFGLTQIEAMAHGLPVITTKNCGDVVQDGHSGFLIPPRDPRSIADAILRFIEDPDLLQRMSINALARSLDFLPEAVWPSFSVPLGFSAPHAG